MKRYNTFIGQQYLKILKYLTDKRKNISFDYKNEIEKYRKASDLKTMNYLYEVISKKKINIDKPIVGYFCKTIPEEIIIAVGATPLRLCNQDIYCAEIGEEIIPGDICPVIKAICGYLQNDIKIDLLVIPATCDGKTKLAEILTPIFNDRIYFIDIPRNSDYIENIDLWESAYLKFYDYLKNRFKAKPSRKELLSVCKMTNKRTEIFRKIYQLRGEKTGIINSFDYFILTSASFYLSPSDWSEHAEILYKELLGKVVKQNYRKRILLAGSPIIFPNFKILEIIEDSNCYIASDILCSGYGHLFDPVKIDEETELGIIRALTLKYIAPNLCPCFLGIDKLLNAILENMDKYTLDGVVYYNLRLCNVFEIEIPILKDILKNKGIPLLVLKTDFSREDIGQLKTRLEAFIEMLK
ncbi:MAG: 2-hydroxyacyl-CoA dehydratase family protein [Candidatus Omnitrophica bacterium]|nr:2-hydroxyacyl-CoA dehydratase family protein [Candidatus Omnitrophota bacterium]MCM8802644.1 2-hydroxyacyl-CoA dehydratase family protein [Candidatus Omnitrophota bacterium]